MCQRFLGADREPSRVQRPVVDGVLLRWVSGPVSMTFDGEMSCAAINAGPSTSTVSGQEDQRNVQNRTDAQEVLDSITSRRDQSARKMRDVAKTAVTIQACCVTRMGQVA